MHGRFRKGDRERRDVGDGKQAREAPAHSLCERTREAVEIAQDANQKGHACCGILVAQPAAQTRAYDGAKKVAAAKVSAAQKERDVARARACKFAGANDDQLQHHAPEVIDAYVALRWRGLTGFPANTDATQNQHRKYPEDVPLEAMCGGLRFWICMRGIVRANKLGRIYFSKCPHFQWVDVQNPWERRRNFPNWSVCCGLGRGHVRWRANSIERPAVASHVQRVTDADLHCAFCGRDQYAVKQLIAGPKALICNECVRQMHDILLDYEKSTTTAPVPP